MTPLEICIVALLVLVVALIFMIVYDYPPMDIRGGQKFAEWLGENHYRLINVNSNGEKQWGSYDSKDIKTTKELYEEYLKSK